MQISPSTFLYSLLTLVALIWGFVGTVLVRWTAAVLKQILGQLQTPPTGHLHNKIVSAMSVDDPQAVSIEQDNRRYLDNLFKVPTYPSAFGVVLLNTLVLGIALVITVTFAAGPANDAPDFHPVMIGIGLSLMVFLVGLALIWINREILGTTWLSAAIITAAYLTGTTLVTSILFLVLLAGSGAAR